MSKTQTVAVVVTWREGWTMEYQDRGGHNVRLTDAAGSLHSTGCKSLVEAITWAGAVMSRAG